MNQPPEYPTTPVSSMPSGIPPKRRRLKWWHWLLIVVGLLVVLGIIGSIVGPQPSPAVSVSPTATSAPTQASQPTVAVKPTATPTSAPRPTPTPRPIYPPKSKADLQALAAKGDASQIHEFHSESVGLTGACPQPKREVTVDPALTGQQLAEDLLAYFYQNQLDSPCGSLVLAYHNQSEVGDFYSAGRVLLQTDNPGSDPNATNIKYTLTLDLGDAVGNEQEYVVSYQQ